RVCGLPTITLYLLAGAACFQLGGISHETVDQLLPLHHAALAVITLAAGSELALDQLQSHARTIRCITIALALAALGVVFCLTLLVITSSVTLGSDASLTVTCIASMFAAVIAIARSPSSAIGVVSEQRADGPFTQTVLSVTMVTDVLVIVLFTACLELAQVILNPSTSSPLRLLLRFAARTLCTLSLSLVHGGVLAVMCLLTLRLPPSPSPLRLLALLGVGCFAFMAESLLHLATRGSAVEDFMQLEPMLSAIAAGFAVCNLTWPFALALFGARLLSLRLGVAVGGAWAEASPEIRRYAWLAFITQAGVSLGLIEQVAEKFPLWGVALQSPLVAVIVLNQLVGPPLLKYSLRMTREIGKAASATEMDKLRSVQNTDKQAVALVERLAERITSPSSLTALFAAAAAAASTLITQARGEASRRAMHNRARSTSGWGLGWQTQSEIAWISSGLDAEGQSSDALQ
ncbi:MAG: hypothetical protein SGPRY_005894, partial [Prymnesium sp.]